MDSLQILVVDGHREDADSFAQALSAGGHQVEVAYGGAEALARARAKSFDVVALFITIPKLDGLWVAREIRDNSLSKKALLIAVTGFADLGNQLIAHGEWFDHHFPKPLDTMTLLSILRDWTQSSNGGGLFDPSQGRGTIQWRYPGV